MQTTIRPMTYLVTLPSGRRVTATGVFAVARLRGYEHPLPVVSPEEGEEVFAFDPRAVVTDEEGRVVYDGSDVRL